MSTNVNWEKYDMMRINRITNNLKLNSKAHIKLINIDMLTLIKN
jgi:hypothetical protein